jgi:type IV pilus assembly protein PilV
MQIALQKHTGFTLVEVLVAMVVLAIGLIGVAGIQAAAVKYTKGAEGRSYAAQLAYDITDRMKASRGSVVNGGYSSLAQFQATTCNPNLSASAAIQSKTDETLWRNQLACSIPGGQGQVEIGAPLPNGLVPVTVRIRWDEGRMVGGSANYAYETSTQL